MSDANYRSLGVSACKADVLAAARLQGPGLFPGAFCKIVPDLIGGDPDRCLAMHSDGAGTKSVVAYLAFRESGDAQVFASLAQDALVMNIDDLVCVGARGPFVVTNTIGRHRDRIPAEAIEAIVAGYEQCRLAWAELGVEISLCGGETADIGDLVRTVVVDAAVASGLDRNAVIDGGRVAPGDLIVALGSAGKARYEARPNSGIGSNGLTLARHALLAAEYRELYPEAAAPDLPAASAYRGPYRLADRPGALGMSIGEALLSPTRLYAPAVLRALEEIGTGVHGVVHCTGGGQTKCLRLPARVSFVKDALLEVPAVFELIRAAGAVSLAEMYQVFNMGHRMELYVDPAAADEVTAIAAELELPGRVVGRCEAERSGPRLRIEVGGAALGFGQ